MNVFINNIKKEYIKIFFKNKILKKLNNYEFNTIMELLCKLINYLSIRFCFDPQNNDAYWNQLLQNNHRDLIAIFNLLLPYIDDKEGTYFLHNQIENISDISLKKIPTTTTKHPSRNNFLISNIQYNLYGTFKHGLYSYNLKNIITNYILLLETIDRISNKLFINWLNIRPITINDYKNSYLYKNSIQLMPANYFTDYVISHPLFGPSKTFLGITLQDRLLYYTYIDKYENNNTEYDDLVKESRSININETNKTYEPNMINKGISIGDVFNTIYHDLFYDIYKIKWLIFQGTFNDSDHDQIYIEVFNNLIAVPEMYLGVKWSEMSREKQILFSNNWESFLQLVASQDDMPTNLNPGEDKFMYLNHYVIMLQKIIVSMESNYDLINSIVSHFGYKKISKIDDESKMFIYDDNDDDDSDIKDVYTNFELVKNIKQIPHEDIYNHLFSTIQDFIYTWYGRNIIIQFDPLNPTDSNNSLRGVIMNGLPGFKFNYESYTEKSEGGLSGIIPKILNLGPFTFHFPEKLNLKYKFFYNYAKAFVKVYHNKKKKNNNDNQTESYYRQNWYELDDVEKKVLINFLNSSYINAKDDEKIVYENGTLQKEEKKEFEKMSVMSFVKYYKRTYSKSENRFYKSIDDEGNLVNTDMELFGETSQPDNIKGLGNFIGSIFFGFIRDKLIDITFESHIYKGLLTEFVISPELTDNKLLGSSYEEKTRNQFMLLKKTVLSPDNLNNYKNNAFYFLTNKTFGLLNEIHRGKKKNYFDLLTSEYRWYSFYSMDWIAQINFFHHYINNRVIYVTGATGQGKSTQVPKLFLYGLKMIDRKMNGRVICSQPRVNPTRENTEQISWELGVPITEISEKTKQKIKTYNGYIQYDTQDDYHVVENHNGLKLKLVTDRKLYEELRKYPVYKQTTKSHNENKTSDDIEFNIYNSENRDDIIIVDESHEHNLNMDLILTVARDTIRINNSLKLVIVSATMADDEYIYRRYYKEIDDNFAYPYSFYNAEYNLNRINVDRRIHISPPGETTQHKVTDYYLKNEPESYYEAETLAYNKVIELATDPSSKGDILLFSLGTKEIIKLVKTINEALPLNSDFICLPFYSELPIKWTSMFNDLSKKVREITVHRNDLYDEIFPDPGKIVRQVSKNTYKRVIIVATNIAEASITVNSLKYVVDTGYFISVSDNFISNEPVITPKKISESSRVQRRGRVGRVGAGTVYYMYKKNSRLGFKSEPKICIENIFLDLYNLASSYSIEENFILSSIDWSKYIHEKINTSNLKLLIKSSAPQLNESKLVNNLLLKQYTYRNKLILSTLNLISKKTHKIEIEKIIEFNEYAAITTLFSVSQMYNMLSNRYTRQITGYDIKQCIYDPFGTFYIVHPDELMFKRNLLTGEIIEVFTPLNPIPIPSEIIISYKIHKYLDKCFSYNLFIDNNLKPIDNDIFHENLENEFRNVKNEYTKTTIGRIVSNIAANIKFHEKDNNINWFMIYVIIYAYICNIDDLVIIIISLINFSNYSLSGLNPNINFLQKYGSEDLEIYFNIAQELHIFMKTFTSSVIDTRILQFEKEKRQYLDQKEKINNDLKLKQNYWNLIIPTELYERFNSLDNRNKLNSTINLSDYMKDKNKKSQFLESDIDRLLGKFLSLGIIADRNSVIRFIRFYKEIKNQIDKLKNAENIPTNSNDLLWFKNNVPVNVSTDIWTNVKKAFIYGFGIFNVAIFHPQSKIIFDHNNPKKYYTMSQNSITKPNNFMVYLMKERNDMSIVINSDLETLAECTLYNYSPYKLTNFNIVNVTEHNSSDNPEIFFVNKYLELLNQRYKLIGNLTLKHHMVQNGKKLDKLFANPNNLIEYLIKLWTINFTPNIFGKAAINNKNYIRQYGGQIQIKQHKQHKQHKYKIKISKLPYILGKFNINIETFFNSLKKTNDKYHNIEITNDYIILRQNT